MSSTDDSSSSDDSGSVIAVNTPATSVHVRRLFDGMPPGVDRISVLPDEILLYLLSFLPVQDTVRTCVLAQRWRHLWKSTTKLRIMGTKGPGSTNGKQPFHLDGLPFASRYLTTLSLYNVRLNGTFLDFSRCPTLEYLKLCSAGFNVSKMALPSVKHLKIYRCRSFLDHRLRVSAPCLVSLILDDFSGITTGERIFACITPLLEGMTLLETAFVNLCDSLHNTSQEICLRYRMCGVFCGTSTNDVRCVNCLHYNHGSSNTSVLLGAIYNAKHLKLISSSGMIIFTRDLKWCPTFKNLRNLLLNDYWCVGPDFNALSCILKHSPVLEKLTLQLISEGKRPNVEMKGSYSPTERSTVISQHLKIVDVKCYVVDEKVAKVLKFLCTLNLRFCFV
ncbi:unnamed protein product [Alopecurus aequalis]